MNRLIGTLALAASAALVLPLSIMPDAVSKCADSTWSFRPATQNPLNAVAADKARSQFCDAVAASL